MNKRALFVASASAAWSLWMIAACSSFSEVDPYPDSEAGPEAGSTDTGAETGADTGADTGAEAADAGPRYVFVTSSAVVGAFAADGGTALGAAASLCRAAAAPFPSLENRTWLPWIFTDRAPALPEAAIYVNVSGEVVFAPSSATMLDLSTQNPLAMMLTEDGGTLGQGEFVWTGLAETSGGGANCSDWTDLGVFAFTGDPSSTGTSWSSSVISRRCNVGPGHLYCFEVSAP